MKKELVIVLLACISILWSCGKYPLTNGEEMELDRRLDKPFKIVDIGDNIDVTLLHSDATHPAGLVHIRTGKNLMDGFRSEVEGDTLIIRNDNGGAFLRPYDYPREMTVYYDSLLQLTLNSNADCIQTDTLRGYLYPTHFTHSATDTLGFDSLVPNLHVFVEGGSGNFNVLTNCYKVVTKFFHGTSTVTLGGQAIEYTVYGDYDCHGIIDASGLESEYVTIDNYGTNAITGKAFRRFKALNENIGLVHYVRYYKVKKKIIWGHFEGSHWVQNDTIDTTYYCPLNVIKEGRYKENITSIHLNP